MAKCVRAEIIKGKEKPLSSNWRADGFLWKPLAEHESGVVVLTTIKDKATSVIAYDLKEVKIKTFRYRPHSGPEAPVGDAWQDYEHTGDWYHKNYPKGILVKVRYPNMKVRTFKLTCPQNRSDGK